MNEFEEITDEEIDALLDESGDLGEALEEAELNEEVPDIDDDGEEMPEPAPTKTYALDFGTGAMGGVIDGELALKQFIIKALLTPRDTYEVYTSLYGSEISAILAEQESADYVAIELERVITEAIEDDDRIISVESVEIETEDDRVYAVATVNSIYGEITQEVEI